MQHNSLQDEFQLYTLNILLQEICEKNYKLQYNFYENT